MALYTALYCMCSSMQFRSTTISHRNWRRLGAFSIGRSRACSSWYRYRYRGNSRMVHNNKKPPNRPNQTQSKNFDTFGSGTSPLNTVHCRVQLLITVPVLYCICRLTPPCNRFVESFLRSVIDASSQKGFVDTVEYRTTRKAFLSLDAPSNETSRK